MLNPVPPLRSSTVPPVAFRHAAAPVDRVDLRGDAGPEGSAFLDRLAKAGVEGDEAALAARAVAAPAGALSLAERIGVYERLTSRPEASVRRAMFGAWRRDVEAGVPPAEAEAGLRRLDAALDGRISLWEWQLVPVFDAYAQCFAGTPEARAGLDLMVFLSSKRIHGDAAAAAARELAKPLDGMPLERRTALFGRLLESAEDPEAALVGWTLLRAELEAGRDGGAAVDRVRKLTAGLREAGLDQDFEQKPVLEACREHLAAAPALFPGWPLRLLKEGVRGDELVEAIREAGEFLGPLLRGASPDLEAAIGSPWKGSWKAHLEALREMLALARGPEPVGTIGEEESWVLIGDVSLPRRTSAP